MIQLSATDAASALQSQPAVLIMQWREMVLFLITVSGAVVAVLAGLYRAYRGVVKSFNVAVIDIVKPLIEDLTRAIEKHSETHVNTARDLSLRIDDNDAALERHGAQLDEQATDLTDLDKRLTLVEHGLVNIPPVS